MEQMRETVQHLIDLDEPEALLTALKRAAQRKPGERWQKLADVLERAEAAIENEQQPGATTNYDKHVESHLPDEPKAT
jgi:hypothetical protein